MTMTTHARFEHGAQLKIDYTPGSALEAGDIVDLGGGLVGVANRAIAANEKDALDVGGGVYAVKKAAGTGVTFAVGAEVYWDTVAETAVATPSANTTPFGICCEAAVTDDDNVKAILNVHANLLDMAALGTVEAGKIVVVDANKDIGDFRNLDCVNLDAGSSGVAGTVDVFPATASKGKFTLACADQTGNTTVMMQADEMGQATTVHVPDPGAAASYVAQSTAALTLAEVDVLDAVTPGTLAASKAIVVNAAKHVDEISTASLKLGASGATVAVTATAAEINTLDRTGAAGVAEASKAVVLDANKHLDEVNTASLKLGATGATVAVTATAAQLNALASSSAGLAALLASGLGGSAAFVKTDAATTTLLAAHGTKDRACLVVVHVDETYDVGTGTLPTVKIGEDDTVEKCMAATVLDTEAAGTVLVFAFTNTATKKIIVTTTAAVGNATGGCTVTVLAIPTT